jgi:hypothetical protein
MKTRKMQFEVCRSLMWVLSQVREVLEAQALVVWTPLIPAQARRRRYVALRGKVMARPMEKPQSQRSK